MHGEISQSEPIVAAPSLVWTIVGYLLVWGIVVYLWFLVYSAAITPFEPQSLTAQLVAGIGNNLGQSWDFEPPLWMEIAVFVLFVPLFFLSYRFFVWLLSINIYNAGSSPLGLLWFIAFIVPYLLFTGSNLTASFYQFSNPFVNVPSSISGGDVIIFWFDQILRGCLFDFVEAYDPAISENFPNWNPLEVRGDALGFMFLVGAFRFVVMGGFVYGILRIFGRELKKMEPTYNQLIQSSVDR